MFRQELFMPLLQANKPSWWRLQPSTKHLCRGRRGKRILTRQQECEEMFTPVFTPLLPSGWMSSWLFGVKSKECLGQMIHQWSRAHAQTHTHTRLLKLFSQDYFFLFNPTSQLAADLRLIVFYFIFSNTLSDRPHWRSFSVCLHCALKLKPSGS